MATLTVKGVPITPTQITAAETLLSAPASAAPGQIASEAIIFAAIAESTLGDTAGTYQNNGAPGGGYWGVLQGNAITWPDPHDTAGMATSFYNGGNGFQGGGAIALARSISDPILIAVKVEVPDGGQGYGYSRESGYDGPGWLAEAKAIVATYGGMTAKGGTAGSGGSGTVVNGSSSTTYQFAVGSTDNPDEDYWTGTNRLAQEVNWYYFSNGEYLFYLDGPEMIAQRPAMTLDRVADRGRILSLRGTYDNTAFQYVSDHLRKFRPQRKTKLTVVTSPTQVTLELICGIDEFRGGDVIELANFGLMDGRWIVGSLQRSVYEVASTITLVPPIAPLTESQVAGATGRKQAAPGSPASGAAGTPTGTLGNYVSPFVKKYTADLANTDMGVDFGSQQGISPGDPILAIGDCFCRSNQAFYTGSVNPQALWFELNDKSIGYWGFYVSEQIVEKVGPGPILIKAGTVVATFAPFPGTGIEFGFAAGPGLTATAAFHPNETASRHDGNGTTDGRAMLAFLKNVGAI